MGYPRFFSQNLLTDPAMLTVSSARLGERGAAVAEVLGAGTCYAQGDYSGDLAVEQFVIEIDGAGDLGVATFRWKGGATSIWEANHVATSDSLTLLRDGISVRFGGSGFLAGDRFLIEARRPYGRASLLDVDPGVVWRSTGCALETIAADLGVPRQVAAFILARHNLSAGATATLRATSQPDLASLPRSDYDESNGDIVASMIAGTAFVMPDLASAADLSPYAGTHLIVMIDGAGKIAWARIGAAGTGLALGSELVANGDFSAWTGDDPDGWSLSAAEDADSYVTEDPSGNCKVVRGPSSHMNPQQNILEAGKLYNYSVEVIAVSSRAGFAYGYPSGWTSPGTKSGYFTGINDRPYLGVYTYYGSTTATFDNVSAKQVAAPPATGVWLESIAGAADKTWAHIDSGFDANGIAAYDLYPICDLVGDWTSPPYSQALDVSLPNLVLFLDQTYRYWRLELADPANPAGYLQAAGLYLGSYTQLSRRMQTGPTETLAVSRTEQRVEGALRPSPVGPLVNYWKIQFSKLATDDRTVLRALFARVHDRQSYPLWFLPDSDDLEGLLYGFLGASLALQLSNPGRHAVSLEFEEFVP